MTGFLGTGWAAQQAAAPGPGLDGPFMLMIAAIFAIFYFLVLRPQQKKQRALEEAVKSAAKGDRIVTSGGLHGKIVSTAEDVVTVEIATLKGGQSVRVQVSRSGLTTVTSKSAAEKGEKSAAAGKEKGSDS
jgi:preprotein translocase subunit YajC